MAINVTDFRSHREEQIDHAAKVIRRSIHAQKIFEEIYRGKTKVKTVPFLMEKTGLTNVRVLQIGGKLHGDGIIGTQKVASRTAYTKDPFYAQHKEEILRLARNPKALESFHTTRNPKPATLRVVLDLQRDSIQTRSLTIDDIDSFSRVRSIKKAPGPRPIVESTFKKGIKRILNEIGEFHDWGGEKNDLFTTRLKIKGRRKPAAFGFKGKGTKGLLTPKKLGKNGDQVQRLFDSEADVFIVQYWGAISPSVYEQMSRFAVWKSSSAHRMIHFGIIDGNDTQRLIAAYPSFF